MATGLLTSKRWVFYVSSMHRVVQKLGFRTMFSVISKQNLSPRSTTQTSGLTFDSNYPLPGNVGVDMNQLDKKQTDRNSPKVKYESLTSALLKLENETQRKHDVVSQFVSDDAENVTDSGAKKVECKIQQCPATLRKGFLNLFSGLELGTELTVITISQATSHDMSVWSKEMEQERDKLISLFVENAKLICKKIIECGYWADFIDPVSGHAFNGLHRNETLFETDDRFNQLGFTVDDLGCCKVLLHKEWNSNVFMGVIFTNAPTTSDVFGNL